MRFKKPRDDMPEVNIIPLIDIMMSVLIFLVVTTTFSKFTELQLQLPVANAEAAREYPQEVVVSVSSEGRYAVNKQILEDHSAESIAAALRAANVSADSVLIISADAATPHQAVINVLEAARRIDMHKITFATRKPE